MALIIGPSEPPSGGYVQGSYLYKGVTYNSNPGKGYLNLNNLNPSLATILVINYESISGFNYKPFLTDIRTGDKITIFNQNDGRTNYVFDATADVDLQVGYARLHISVDRIEGLFKSNDEVGILIGVGSAVSHSPVTLHPGDTTQEAANIAGQVLELVLATLTTDGVMSAEDKTKLDGIEDGAEINLVDSVFGRTGDVVAVSSDYDANQIDYSNVVSGLLSTDVQGAIDELVTPDSGSVEFFVSHKSDFVFNSGHVVVKNYII